MRPRAHGTISGRSKRGPRGRATIEGFTLIEMMVVVAIVVVLSVVAMVSYRKYMDNARKSEVVSMFAEIRNREEAYRAEFSSYLTVSQSETDFWPVLIASGEPKAKMWLPASGKWSDLGVNPGKAELYCGFSVISGAGGSLAGAGARGNGAFSTVPTGPWWYATGTCDNDGKPAVNAIFVTTSESQTMFEQNPHD